MAPLVRTLLSIASHIALDNPAAARAVVQRVQARIRDLAVFPEQGRATLRGLRELVITGTPYLAVYRVSETEVLILRVLHGRQHRET